MNSLLQTNLNTDFPYELGDYNNVPTYAITWSAVFILTLFASFLALRTLKQSRKFYTQYTKFQENAKLTLNSFFNGILYVYEVGANCSLSFEYTIPWSSSGQSVGSVLLPTLLILPTNITISYQYYIWAIASFCFLSTFYLILLHIFAYLRRVPPFLSVCGIILFPSYLVIRLSSALWLGLIRALLTVFTCGGDNSELDSDIECWGEIHLYYYVIPASIGFIPFLFFQLSVIPKFESGGRSSSNSNGTMQPLANTAAQQQQQAQAPAAASTDDDLYVDPLFTFAKLLAQFILGALLTFIPEYMFARLVVLLISMLILLYLHHSIPKPCSVLSVKDWRTVGYFLAFWCACCAIATQIINDRDNFIPFYVLIGVNGFSLLLFTSIRYKYCRHPVQQQLGMLQAMNPGVEINAVNNHYHRMNDDAA